MTKTTTKTVEIEQASDKAEAIKWLESEYPNGTELIYIDYNDNYNENLEALQKILKGDNEEDESWDWEWQADAQHASISEIQENYMAEIEADELSDEVEEAMKEWLWEHDKSDPTSDLLRNTSNKLCFIETPDFSEEDNSNAEELIKKYGKTPEQKKEIEYVLREQFYGAQVSFYFYLDPADILNAINSKEKYILISGAYFSTIDRGQGSNWLGEEAIFDLVIPREKFIENFYLDEAKGNGYSWQEIAGDCGYTEAGIYTVDTQKKGAIRLLPETSEQQQREQRLQKKWDETGKCTAGDMTWNRHKSESITYSNNYPCGSTCKDCGTFWID